MRRAPKTPKRVRAAIRAEARRRGAPIFVAEAGGRPSRLLNVAPEGGELLEGLGVIPGHRPGRGAGKTRAAVEALGVRVGVDLSTGEDETGTIEVCTPSSSPPSTPPSPTR